MKTAAAKATKSHSPSITHAGGFFGGIRSAGFFGAVQRQPRPESAIQKKLSVSKPADPLEQEADRTADRVLREPADRVTRVAEPVTPVQRFGEGTPTVGADTQGEIVRATTGGQALPAGVRSDLEPRLGADLGDVRVHADESAASLSNHLSARAFTYRNHVFFGRGQYRPETASGRHLLTHELTHTIQQGATVQRAVRPAGERTPDEQRAARTEPPQVQRSGSAAVPQVQRWGLDSVLNYFADKAAYLPGFRMLTLVIGFNPINLRSVDRTPANFLRALIELVPGGVLITRALDSHGVINRAADWVGRKVEALGDIGSSIVDGIKRFVAGLEWSDAFDPGGVWDRAKRVVTDPIGRLVSFGVGVVGELLALVKEAILRPLAALAEGTAGYDLLKAVLGQDPITGDPVPRTADTLIGGFMKLIGQEEIWLNLKKGNAVARAFAWFQGALTGLLGFVRSIPRRVVQTISSLTFEDVVTVVGAFRKVGSAFVGLVAEFGSWAGNQVLRLLEILVSVVAPGALPYIAKAKAAFHTIIRDPVRFIGNLVRAGKLGFQNFAKNILTHLQTALIKWITGPLGEAGVYIPASFSLVEIVKLVLSVLGLTWQNIRSKLVKIIPEPILAGLEKTAGVLVTLVTQGPAAAWEQIKDELTELKDQLIGQVTQMISTEIVKAAVTKLASMLNPAGAVIQAIIAVYNTVMFFVEKISQIGAVVASFIDSISAIAAGQVAGAAQRVEQTLANTLTVVLAFLARFAGFGGIPDKVVGIVKKIRAPIDKALDRIVAWLGALLDKLVGKAKAAAKRLLEWWTKKVPIRGASEPHTLTFKGERKAAKLVVMSEPEKPSVFVTREATKASKLAEASKHITDAGKQEVGIEKTQKELAEFDDKPVTPTGPDRLAADSKSKELDRQLGDLAVAIGHAVATYAVDELVTPVNLPREVVRLDAQGKPLLDSKGKKKMRKMVDWTEPQKMGVKQEHERMKGDPTLVDDKGNLTDRVNFARRHVVSLRDVGAHYEKVLTGKKSSAAKILLEQRGSVAAARTPVGSPLGSKSILEAVLKRWREFFGYARNIFIGDSRINSAIQDRLDPDHPEMQGDPKRIDDHIAHVKRGWALDDTFKESR